MSLTSTTRCLATEAVDIYTAGWVCKDGSTLNNNPKPLQEVMTEAGRRPREFLPAQQCGAYTR